MTTDRERRITAEHFMLLNLARQLRANHQHELADVLADWTERARLAQKFEDDARPSYSTSTGGPAPWRNQSVGFATDITPMLVRGTK